MISLINDKQSTFYSNRFRTISRTDRKMRNILYDDYVRQDGARKWNIYMVCYYHNHFSDNSQAFCMLLIWVPKN